MLGIGKHDCLMALSLVPARSTHLCWRHLTSAKGVCRAMGEENASRLIRFAAGGVVLWTAGQMARMLYLGVLEGAPGTRVWIITATAIYLPLQVVLVLRAVRNVRPRSSWWLLAGVALAIVGSLPLGGVVWIP